MEENWDNDSPETVQLQNPFPLNISELDSQLDNSNFEQLSVQPIDEEATGETVTRSELCSDEGACLRGVLR